MPHSKGEAGGNMTRREMNETLVYFFIARTKYQTKAS